MKNIDNVAVFFTVFLLIICIFIKKDEYFNGNVYHTINESGKEFKYKVQDRHDKGEAANRLHRLNFKVNQMINYLHEKEPDHQGVKRLKNRYRPDILSELHEGSSNTSYSINKGEKIVVCLRSKDDYSFQDENTVFFVVLHELAHIMTVSIGHKEDFWENFRYLLKHCIDIKLYKYQDFNSKSEPYCGIEITDTPYKM
tara:strand:+ start:200 stop:793 length:594 start_codon:yes stop_codon:yes gene_type:complete